jgi:hypothetical protein
MIVFYGCVHQVFRDILDCRGRDVPGDVPGNCWKEFQLQDEGLHRPSSPGSSFA